MLFTYITSGALNSFESGRIIFDGIVFDGNKANRNVVTSTALINLRKVSRLTVRNCLLKDHQYILFAIQGAGRVIIEDNEFSGWGKPTSAPAEGGAALYCSSNADLTPVNKLGVCGNWFHDGEWAAIYDYGAESLFDGNWIENVKEAGYFGRSDQAPARRRIVTNNHIIGVTSKSIDGVGILASGENDLVSGNIIRDCDYAGIGVTVQGKAMIADNDVANCAINAGATAFGQIDVRISSASVAPSDLTIKGNKVRSSGSSPYGIRVRRVAGSLVLDNLTVADNDVRSAAISSANNLVIDSGIVGASPLVRNNIGSSPSDLKSNDALFALADSAFGLYVPRGGTVTTVDLMGMADVQVGTATARTADSSSYFTNSRRVGFVSSASAGTIASTRSNITQVTRGNAANLGGFHYKCSFGISDNAAVADARMFVGLYNSSADIGNVDPSSLIQMIGVGCDHGEAQLSIMTNDASGTATKTSLGSSFPANTQNTDWYELELRCEPNGSRVEWTVNRRNTGDTISGVISSDLPSANAVLVPHIWRNNGATALAVGIDVGFQAINMRGSIGWSL